MGTKRDVTVSGGILAFSGLFLCALLAGRSQVPSALPSITSYNCFGQFYMLLESVAVLGSPAQWMVALFGFLLYPALSRTGRAASAPPAGAVGSSAQSTNDVARPCGLGSHSIQLEPSRKGNNGPRAPGGGFFKRLRRVLAEGRVQARKLCGQESLRTAVTSLSRRRSFASRSSKSEDMASSRLSVDTVLRSAQQNAGGGSGGGSGRRGFLQRKGSGGGVGGSRWQPSMSRIASGQHLAGMAASESSMSSVTAGKRLEILSYNGFQAVDCMSHEMTDPLFAGVRQVVTDAHLLQFGSLIGEASAQLALSQGGNAAAVGPAPASLFGPFDRPELYRGGWELVVEEHKPGLHYWSWRRHLRKGLYMYKSKTLYEAATTAQITDFTYDMEFRRTWDDSVVCQLAIAPPSGAPGTPEAGAAGVSLAEAEAKSSGGRSAFMYARTKFPPPMASREYTYARRCWAKPDDGGCYCISRACTHPSPPPAGGRTMRVTDFASGYVIRSSKGIFDTVNPAVEVVNCYFEDPCVPSGITNMGIRRALWPMVQKAEAAFRDYLLTRVHGNLERPPPERPLATDSLGAAIGAQGALAARAAAADADAASCMGGLAPSTGLGLPWRLASPYVLLYRGYVAMWRGGRSALLSALSCCMSLWCNSTGICVGAMAAGKSGLRSAGAWVRSVLATASQALAAASCGLKATGGACDTAPSSLQKAGQLLAMALWPWEALATACGGRSKGAPMASVDRLVRSAVSDSSSSGASRLSSHPLPGAGGAAAGAGSKRLSLALQAGSGSGRTGGAGGADGTQSPRGGGGGGRRARTGVARRCALLAVKLAKVAGAGLLLGRAARAEPAAAAAAPVAQQKQPAQGPSQQKQRRLEAVRRTVTGHRL
ncbi:hypothetical protein PLESTM_002025600 [Pleodorina starrii]|nr:hypothetical protein PLESTM_002025600 [Pleodorina starrii]